jgi:AraC family transcriptional regulator, carnitine catabolism transcriptional activator
MTIGLGIVLIEMKLKQVSEAGPIGILLVPGFTLVAFSSLVESLRLANRYIAQPYRWRLLSIDGLPVTANNGVTIRADSALAESPGLGMLLVCSDLDPESHVTPEVVSVLRSFAHRRVPVGGIDTGPYFLARAGLLDGYRATLHWENAQAFRERFPRVTFTDRLFEIDRDRITCAGGTAAIDLMLHLFEAAHGREVAVRVAEHFMHGRIRTAAETQRQSVMQRFGVHHPSLVQAIEIMERDFDPPAAVPEVARRVGLSLRQLHRLFESHLRTTPAKFYLTARLANARRLIQQSDLSVLEIAVACGFTSPSHFSRVYKQQFGQPPRRDRGP